MCRMSKESTSLCHCGYTGCNDNTAWSIRIVDVDTIDLQHAFANDVLPPHFCAALRDGHILLLVGKHNIIDEENRVQTHCIASMANDLAGSFILAAFDTLVIYRKVLSQRTSEYISYVVHHASYHKSQFYTRICSFLLLAMDRLPSQIVMTHLLNSGCHIHLLEVIIMVLQNDPSFEKR